jgi:long-chain acyl-CoA synthetase
MPHDRDEVGQASAQSRTAESKTVIEMWNRRVAESPLAIAFRFKVADEWRSMSWAEADACARELAAGLVDMGLGVGERVCLISQTRMEWMVCDVGILLTGAISVPIYPSSTPEQCAFIIDDAGGAVVIAEDAVQLEKILSVRARLPSLRAFVHIADDVVLERPDGRGRARVAIDDVRPRGDRSIRSFADLRAAGRARLVSDPVSVGPGRTLTVGPASPLTYIYTSGTTGNPKGVVLSHENVTSAIASCCRAMTLYSSDDQLLFLPLAHVLGRELCWVSVQAGLTTSFAQSIAKLKENLLEVQPTYMVGVPRVFEKFFTGVKAALQQGSGVKRAIAGWALGVGRELTAARQAGRPIDGWLAARRWLAERLVFRKLRAKLGLGRCRFLVSGGAPLAAEIGQFFHGVGILILEGYGLTETVGAAFLNRLDTFRFGTVGAPLDVVESKIADDGEILVRGRSTFREYFKDPKATAEAIDGEGWFHSGDIGHFEDGLLRITDRKKDLIVTAGGKKVPPQPLENAIKGIRWVSQAVVFGDKRPYCVALVTVTEEAMARFAPNGTLDVHGPVYAAIAADIERLNRTLAPYETIKKFAVLPRDFTEADGEMTPSLKVKRKVVSDEYRSVIDGLYAGEPPD